MRKETVEIHIVEHNSSVDRDGLADGEEGTSETYIYELQWRPTAWSQIAGHQGKCG